MASRAAQVVVVGAGSAGLMAALTLATYDVDVLLLEKRADEARISRALVVSTRTLELLRRFGFEQAVRATAVDVLPCAWITSSLPSGDGRQHPLGYPVGEEAARVSPTAPLWAPQHLWEPLLLERLRTLPNVMVRHNCEVRSVSATADGVALTIADEDGQPERIEAAYVVAGDGAHSVVRRSVGIAMEGPADLSEVERVEFRADVDGAVGPLRCGLNVVTDPEAGGVLSPRGNHRNWSITRDTGGSTPRFADMDARDLAAYVRRLVGAETLDVEIEGVRTFRFAAQLATAFRSGRVFLAGDAAHRMTPRGGTGMNTALQDGFDIGWKLGFVLSGWTGSALLDTYERERRRVATHNVERSASVTGAVQPAGEALSWDLDGRIPHHWVGPGTSTVDLPGSALTLLTGPTAPDLPAVRGPVDVHVLAPAVSDALGLAPAGGVLLRPDGKEVRRWAALVPGLDPWQEFRVAIDG